jgi:hypothetical protein
LAGINSSGWEIVLRMTKSQKTIVIAAAVLIVAVKLFPPYWEARLDSKGELAGIYIKWDFNKNLRDMIDPPYHIGPDGWKSVEIWEYTTADDILGIEYLLVLILAGTAFLIAKKWGSERKGMTMTRKVIIIASALLMIFAVMYPPSYSELTSDNWTWINPGWRFIVNLLDHPTKAPKIRFDVLTLEILGILVIAGAAFLVSKRK